MCVRTPKIDALIFPLHFFYTLTARFIFDFIFFFALSFFSLYICMYTYIHRRYYIDYKIIKKPKEEKKESVYTLL